MAQGKKEVNWGTNQGLKWDKSSGQTVRQFRHVGINCLNFRKEEIRNQNLEEDSGWKLIKQPKQIRCLFMPGGRTGEQDPVETLQILNKDFGMLESII